MRGLAKTWAVALLLGLGACGGAGDGTQGGERGGWPRELVTGDGTGPALFLDERASAPAIGYVSPGVVVRIAGAPVGDRIPVRIEGSLKVRGFLAMNRLAARVQERGRVEGTPAYVGPNDLVGVRGSAAGGNLRVEVAPWLGRANAMSLGPFVGELPGSALAATEIDPAQAEPPTPGQAAALPAGAEVPVYDRPGGAVVATLPALDPPLVVVVLRDRGEWKGVRVGVGPYLIGYVDAQLTPAESAPEAGGLIGSAATAGVLPQRLAAEPERPLWRLPARARVRFDGRTVAILAQPGFAREMNRYDTGEVDVFVAVDDHVAVRGMVRATDLQEAAGVAQPAPAPADPAATSPAPAPAPGSDPAPGSAPAPDTSSEPAAPPSAESYTPESY